MPTNLRATQIEILMGYMLKAKTACHHCHLILVPLIRFWPGFPCRVLLQDLYVASRHVDEI